MQKKGFTLIEILIVIFVISMGLILIIRGMSETHRYLSETAQKTIALNLAKEGIEAVYNLRNSNWRKWSDMKDECWLNVTNDFCSDYSRKLTDAQMRILGMNKNTNDWRSPRDISKIQKWERDDNKARFKQISIREKSAFQLLYHQWQRLPQWSIPDTEIQQAKNNSYQYWEYFRVITIHGLFDKITGGKLTCNTTATSPCKSSSPKELRFCSTVFYTKPYQWVVNICSIMTNFEQ